MTIHEIERCRNCACGYHEAVQKKHTKAGEATAKVVDKISKGVNFAMDKGIAFAKKRWEKSHPKTPPPRPPLPEIVYADAVNNHIYEKIDD